MVYPSGMIGVGEGRIDSIRRHEFKEAALAIRWIFKEKVGLAEYRLTG